MAASEADDLWVLLPSAAGMMLVIFSEALGAGQAFADKHGYRLEPSQEMIAQVRELAGRAALDRPPGEAVPPAPEEAHRL